jgi:ribose/xylose/arabinose/galactoside ABC-type transport system permease subunit
MILGRPTNLILGAITALFNVIVLVANSQGSTFFTPEIVAAVNIAAGAIIGLIAGQPPTLAPGDRFITQTPSGQPNAVSVVAEPPAPSPSIEVPK